MARTNENKRHSKYVIRIVCEGDKTEPLFFTDLCDLFYGNSKDFDVRTIPQPNIPIEDADMDSSRGSYKGKKRKVKSGVTIPSTPYFIKPSLFRTLQFKTTKSSKNV